MADDSSRCAASVSAAASAAAAKAAACFGSSLFNALAASSCSLLALPFSHATIVAVVASATFRCAAALPSMLPVRSLTVRPSSFALLIMPESSRFFSAVALDSSPSAAPWSRIACAYWSAIAFASDCF